MSLGHEWVIRLGRYAPSVILDPLQQEHRWLYVGDRDELVTSTCVARKFRAPAAAYRALAKIVDRYPDVFDDDGLAEVRVVRVGTEGAR